MYFLTKPSWSKPVSHQNSAVADGEHRFWKKKDYFIVQAHIFQYINRKIATGFPNFKKKFPILEKNPIWTEIPFAYKNK
jgi:hypothetical protein